MLALSVVDELLDVQMLVPVLEDLGEEAGNRWPEFWVVVFEGEDEPFNPVGLEEVVGSLAWESEEE